MSSIDRIALSSSFNTNLPDNNTGLITPEVLRKELVDIIDSVLFPEDAGTRFIDTASFHHFTSSKVDTLTVVTGSYAVTASNAFSGSQTITGSLILSGSTHTIIGNITSSGNISSSGEVSAVSGTFNTADIDSGTFDQISSLTAANDLDIGDFDFRALTLTADSLTEGSVVLVGADGILTEDDDITFTGDTLSVTKIANVDTTNVTASGDISASGDITGRDITGNSGSFSHVSSSGNVEGNQYASNGEVFAQFAAGAVQLGGALLNPTILSGTSITLGITGQDQPVNVPSHLTASGNISSSATVFGETGSFTFIQANSSSAGTAITVGSEIHFEQPVAISSSVTITDNATLIGNVTITGSLIASSSQNTLEGDLTIKGINPIINIESNTVNGDQQIKFLSEDGSTVFLMKSGVTNNIFDQFSMGAGTSESDLVIDSNGNVGIGIHTPEKELTVSGSISASRDIFGRAGILSNVTASGNISSSAIVFGQTGSFSFLQGNSPITVGSPVTFNEPITASQITGNTEIAGDLTVTSSITASGNISSSGDIQGLTITSVSNISSSATVFGLTGSFSHTLTDTLSSATIVNVSTTHITASGNISSSATVFADTGSFTRLIATDIINVNTTHITASGNISASGNIIGNIAPSNITQPFTHITASGNISASDTVFGLTGSFELISGSNSSGVLEILGTQIRLNPLGGLAELSVESTGCILSGSGHSILGSTQLVGTLDMSTPGHITASGNISGSASSTGSVGSLRVTGASIDFTNLPTSDPGVAGRLYRDGAVVKVSL